MGGAAKEEDGRWVFEEWTEEEECGCWPGVGKEVEPWVYGAGVVVETAVGHLGDEGGAPAVEEMG